MTFTPRQLSPLARKKSPFKDPRPPPCIPGKTARLWDEHERHAVENAKRREASATTPRRSQCSSRFSNGTVMDIIGSYDPSSSPSVPAITASPKFDFGFSRHRKRTSTTVAICKTCTQPITSTLGICERCKKTIVLSSSPGEATPPLSPAARNFASTDLPQLQKVIRETSVSTSTSSSPRRTAHGSPPSSQLVDLPVRLSSLRPPPVLQDSPRPSTDTQRPRKESLTDPNEPFLRLQIARKPMPSTPLTPPSTSHSHHSAPRTRPSSLANVTTPPIKYHSSARHDSASPSELSTLYPYMSASTTTTSPPSLSRASYQLQNTTSAWDDWDSDEEKIGLVGYWKGRKWRGSRGSMGAGRRESGGKEDEAGVSREETGRKRRGFVRVLSCGCSER